MANILLRTLLLCTFITLFGCGGGTPPPDDGGTTPPANNSPIANAGSDQAVDEFGSVTLTGKGSDEDGDALVFAWTVPAGFMHNGVKNKTLEIVNTPEVSKDTKFALTLTATDTNGATHSDEMILTAINNQAPAAGIEIHQGGEAVTVVDENTVVELIGSGSNDSDGDIAGYLWEQTDSGPAIAFADAAVMDTTITVPIVDSDTTFTLKLTVTDDDGDTTSATAMLTVLNRKTAAWYQHTAGNDKLARHVDDAVIPVVTPDYRLLSNCTANTAARLTINEAGYDTVHDTETFAFDIARDGETIAFAADCDQVGTYSLYVANADGSGFYRLVQSIGLHDVDKVRISPNGARIAFLVNDGSGPTLGKGRVELFLVDNNGTPDQTPLKLSPDAPAGAADVRALDANTMRWTSDSKRLLFTGDFTADDQYELWLADLSEPAPATRALLGAEDFTNTSTTELGVSMAPQWAANDHTAYFVSNHEMPALGATQYKLYAISLTDEDATIAKLPSIDAIRYANGSETYTGAVALAPDGSRLAVAKVNPATGILMIYVANADGSGTATNLPGSAVLGAVMRWSPDARLIAFAGRDPDTDKMEPWVARTDGSLQAWQVATASDPATATAALHSLKPFGWTHDSVSLYFTARVDPALGYSLYKVDPLQENGPLNLVDDGVINFQMRVTD